MLSNIEINGIARKLNIPNFRGTFSKDLLPNPMKKGFYVVNMEDSVSKSGKGLPGTHWVMCEVTPHASAYVDSFGCVPPLQICQRATKPIYYSKTDIQNLHSSLCGYFCLYFMAQRSHGRGYKSIVKDFKKNTRDNYGIIDRFFGINAK